MNLALHVSSVQHTWVQVKHTMIVQYTNGEHSLITAYKFGEHSLITAYTFGEHSLIIAYTVHIWEGWTNTYEPFVFMCIRYDNTL